MTIGSFVLMLHSHLPFYRKAGMWPFGEENLYECMAETYLPLLNMLHELLDEGISPRVTIGITPILAEQLSDAYLAEGFLKYIDARLKAVTGDLDRLTPLALQSAEAKAQLALAQFYQGWYTKIRTDFVERYEKNLLRGFKVLQDKGVIEITTSAATHGFLPLLSSDASIQAQLKAGVETYKRHFGRLPLGVWLPECAYRPSQESTDAATGKATLRPSIDAFLFENDLKYFFTEYHAIEGSATSEFRRVIGPYDSEYIPTEQDGEFTGLSTYSAYWMKHYPVAVMGRNNRASFQVWSASHGYPGDGLYREFHRKDNTSGLHYWRLTSKECPLGSKDLYQPEAAFEQTQRHADHFVGLVRELAQEHAKATGEHALIQVSFDTELFGHWWFEGIEWLKQVLKRLSNQQDVALTTASSYLDQYPPKSAIQLPECTWGQGGHYWVWNNHHTDWMWSFIHAAEGKMLQLSKEYGGNTTPLQARILNQALRELLLLESSDWPFLVTTFQAKDYAIERFDGHKDNFWKLVDMVESGTVDESFLGTLEEQNNPFPTVDFRWFHENSLKAPPVKTLA